MTDAAAADSQVLLKTCSKCTTPKPPADFYPCRARRDGLGSYCKACSNKARSHYKKSESLVEYRFVATKLARREIAKPADCPEPGCGAKNVPSHRMRGRVIGDTVQWSCLDCRMEAIAEKRKQAPKAKPAKKHYCDWCSDEQATKQRFCSKPCTWNWFKAKRRREAEGLFVPAMDDEAAYVAEACGYDEATDVLLSSESTAATTAIDDASYDLALDAMIEMAGMDQVADA